MSKRWQSSERTRPLRLRETEHDGTPNTWLYLDERRDGGDWEPVGSAELSHAGVDRRGRLADDVAAEWQYVEYHAAGDRVQVGRRLVVREQDTGLVVALEERREQLLGTQDREEHDWQEHARWRVDTPELLTDGGTSETKQTVWIVGADTLGFKTIVIEDEPTAEDFLESADRSLTAVETELVPSGGEPQWFSPEGCISNYEPSTWDELRRKARESETDTKQGEGDE